MQVNLVAILPPPLYIPSPTKNVRQGVWVQRSPSAKEKNSVLGMVLHTLCEVKFLFAGYRLDTRESADPV